MRHATHYRYTTLPTQKPPAEGDQVSNPALVRSDGTQITFSALAEQGYVLVFVYRGGWCAFCLRRLVDYRNRIAAFRRVGIAVVAISMDEVAAVSHLKQLLKLPFELLSDPAGELISSWNLLNPRDRRAALPATVLLDATMRVRWVNLDDGYSAAQVDDVLAQCIAVVRGDKIGNVARQSFRIPGIMWWLRAAQNELRFGRAPKRLRDPQAAS